MATTQEPFRVQSASEWAQKNGITTWTKFHYDSKPEQSIFTPLNPWGPDSIRQTYFGPIIEFDQQYFLAVGWQTEKEWEKFKLSPEHQQLMANLTTNNVQPETKIIIFTGNIFAIGYTSNVEIFTKPPMFGWIDGQTDWNGESAIASVWSHKWQSQALEQKYKTTEKRLVWGVDGRSYPMAVDAFQNDLKSLGAIGLESVHVAFERVRVVEDAIGRGSRLRVEAMLEKRAT
ncbi:uncharacterized protein FTJAE_6997 [Fusarium tjaetaba]|uniref:Uncharacterized protein n=1 Tax=Fusarium tjaetaba TaxID=1567544 RepID=A0A8H5RKY5_9HYPO|nr:uncharacterized protein FTJAE_6997 [Fusarium tjaetaba]KAF5633846.1 hypothetical protein FTJAE_6997 [Fusarium tjaetaba]